MTVHIRGCVLWLALVALVLAAPRTALAHCDGLDGPVVKAARQALDARKVALVLIWVQERDEPEIRAAFDQTLVVRALGSEARDLADRYFFETVVRVHRAGEGAPFTGLQPAGRDLGPAIPAADKAIQEGSIEAVIKLMAATMEEGLREHFKEVVGARSFRPGDVAAGRRFVKAYVEFIHYVETLHEAMGRPAHGHAAAAPDGLTGSTVTQTARQPGR
jgi:hypothetical protein